jgi:hypothetical protein
MTVTATRLRSRSPVQREPPQELLLCDRVAQARQARRGVASLIAVPSRRAARIPRMLASQPSTTATNVLDRGC